MGKIFLTAVNAVLPIILLILLGYVLKRIKFLNKDFLKIGNKLVFKIFLPCMLFINIYDKLEKFSDIRWDIVLYSVAVICVIFALGLVTAILTTKKKNRRGVILQCCFRSNFAIIGFALVENLGGDSAIAGIVSAFTIPVFNILAVIALTVFAEKEQPVEGEDSSAIQQSAKAKNNVKSVLLNIVKNPLIIGVALGLLFVGIREIERACCGGEIVFSLANNLQFLYTPLKYLSSIATPLALIVLGGQFEFSAVKGMTKEIIVGTVWRIVLAPLIGIGCAIILSKFTPLFGDLTPIYPTLIALFGSPVAVSSAIMAGEMNNDEQLASQLVVWTSICSILTIFLTVFILMSCGLM